jgi:hypothetical protein
MFDQIDAFFSLVERFKKYSAAKQKTDSLPSRFVSLFENHGVHRNQIPRFFDHGLTLADMISDDNLLTKLTPDILKAASEQFAVRLEWLEGVDNEIYEVHDFYKQPKAYQQFLAELVTRSEQPIFAKLVLSTAPRCQEDALLILAETFSYNGEEAVERFHLCGNWFTKYWKSRADLAACIAITEKQSVFLKGFKTSANIESFCAGKRFIADLSDLPYAFERDWLYRKQFKTWYPDSWLYDPEAYLDGVDEGTFGKVSALTRWLEHFEQGYMETGDPRGNAKSEFKAALEKYRKAG